MAQTKSCGGRKRCLCERLRWLKGAGMGKDMPLLVSNTELSSCPRTGRGLWQEGEGTAGPSDPQVSRVVNCRACPPSCVPHSTVCSSFDSERSSPQCLAQHCACNPDLCLKKGGGCRLAQGVFPMNIKRWAATFTCLPNGMKRHGGWLAQVLDIRATTAASSVEWWLWHCHT